VALCFFWPQKGAKGNPPGGEKKGAAPTKERANKWLTLGEKEGGQVGAPLWFVQTAGGYTLYRK